MDYRVRQPRPTYVQEVLAEHSVVELSILRRPNVEALNYSEPVVISVVKNELNRLGDFYRHYREAGIERFAIIDNGSTDGSLEYLCDQSDTLVLSIESQFEWRLKHGWITRAIDLIGRGRDVWYIYVDADEHIVFDSADDTFGQLCARMDAVGVRRIRGLLVDMYREGPLLESTYLAGPLLDAFPFFDGSGYVEDRYTEIVSVKGGPRQRAFGHVNREFRPEMTKYPIFKLIDSEIFANPHHIWPYVANFASPRHLGILHFKFLPDTITRIERAVADKNYWGGSIEYQCYQKVLSADPKLSLMCDYSRRYLNPKSLTEAGLIVPVEGAAVQ